MTPMDDRRDESGALEYLRRARPGAIEHLSRFLEESSAHLHPRTRRLIAVALETAAGSGQGLRAEIRRALDAGAAADEVLDAILCSCPRAGLDRVLDAVDALRSMAEVKDDEVRVDGS